MATAVVVAIAAVASISESRKARKASRRARKVDERRGRLQAGRQAIDGVRQAQIARAQIAQGAVNSGVGGSSASLGAQGAVQSQAGGNIGFAQQVFNLQQSRNRLINSAAMHTFNSNAFATIGSAAAGFVQAGQGKRADGGAPVTDLSTSAGG